MVTLADARGKRFVALALSVKQAANAMKAVAAATKGRGAVPFAADTAGNFWLLDSTGRVLEWDHETQRVSTLAASLSKVVRSSIAFHVWRTKQAAREARQEKSAQARARHTARQAEQVASSPSKADKLAGGWLKKLPTASLATVERFREEVAALPQEVGLALVRKVYDGLAEHRGIVEPLLLERLVQLERWDEVMTLASPGCASTLAEQAYERGRFAEASRLFARTGTWREALERLRAPKSSWNAVYALREAVGTAVSAAIVQQKKLGDRSVASELGSALREEARVTEARLADRWTATDMATKKELAALVRLLTGIAALASLQGARGLLHEALERARALESAASESVRAGVRPEWKLAGFDPTSRSTPTLGRDARGRSGAQALREIT